MQTRRKFLESGSTLCLAGLGGNAVSSLCAADALGTSPILSIGLMTDLHYADKPERGTRYYREATTKLDEAVTLMNQEKPDLVAELGDFIDQADSVDLELEWLKTMESHYAKLSMPRHYVVGNHCVGTLSKKEFTGHTEAAPDGFTTFETKGIRFLILDSCFREDGVAYQRSNFHWQDANIPPHEITWLKDQLNQGEEPVIVLCHQRLDEDKAHAVRNAPEVRKALSDSGRVLAVFQGHSHKNDLQQIDSIPYCTLAAMVEGSGAEQNGYSLLDVMPDTSLRLNGFRRQEDRMFPGASE